MVVLSVLGRLAQVIGGDFSGDCFLLESCEMLLPKISLLAAWPDADNAHFFVNVKSEVSISIVPIS
jgi:hypothetical protein